MGRFMVPLLAAMGLVWTQPGAAALEQADAPASCVEASQSDHPTRNDTLVIELDNGCQTAVACKIDWEVHCVDGAVHAVSRQAQIDAGQRRAVQASASMCTNSGWRITPPRWSCEPRK